MDIRKEGFLRNEMIPLIRTLNGEAKAKWGLMNGQQMAEHMADFFKVSYNKYRFPVVTPEEHLPKFKAFLLSDKEFRENTKAPSNIVPDEPRPIRNKNMQEAVDELKSDIDEFFLFFENDPGAKTSHPVFGELDFSEWILLHHKHVTHHFKQFGLI